MSGRVLSGHQAAISAKSINLESICTLESILGQTANDVSNCNIAIENEIIYDLVTKFTVADIIANSPQSQIYTNPNDPSSNIYYKNVLDDEQRSVISVVTTTGSNDGNFALSSSYAESSIDNEVETGYIGDAEVSVSIVAPTLPYYDATINITGTEINGPFYTIDASHQFTSGFTGDNSVFSANFDGSNNSNYLRALNSRFGRTDNTDPMNIQEDISFNTTYSLGSNLNSFYTIDPITGKPTPHTLSLINQTAHNNIDIAISLTDTSGNENEYGTYKIVQHNDIPNVVVSVPGPTPPAPGDINIPPSSLPFINSSTLSELPSSLTIEQYKSIFNLDTEVFSGIPNYNFTMNVHSENNSGYSLDSSYNNDIFTDSHNTFTLDNSNLTDNYTYMQNFVGGDHTISFNNAALTIKADPSASQQNINEFFTLSNNRETLTQDEWADGEILLDINDPTSRVSVNTNAGDNENLLLKANVYYNNEDSSKESITTELATNQTVRFQNELVFKKPTDDVNYALSNGVGLNLFSGSTIVNNVFNTDDIVFESNYSVGDNEIDIFKITSRQNLDATSLFSDNSGNLMEGYNVVGSFSNFTQLINTKSLNIVKLSANLQEVSNLELYKSANLAGWSLRNTNDNRIPVSTVTSSLNSAMPMNPLDAMDSGNQPYPTTWPNKYPGVSYINNSINNIDEVQEVIINDASLNYTISLVPQPSRSSTIISPNFYASINWQLQDGSASLIKNYDVNTDISEDPADTIVTSSVVNSATYYLTNTITNANNIVLIQNTLTHRKQLVDFNVNLVPYDNLNLKTPEFSITYTYYTLQYNMGTSTTKVNNYSNLRFVKSYSDASFLYSKINYRINGLNSNSPLSFSGVLGSKDLQEFSNIHLIAINDDNTTTKLTQNYTSSAFYSIPLTMEFYSDFEQDDDKIGDVVVCLGENTGVTYELNSQSGYYTMFMPNRTLDYSVEYFHSTVENLSNSIPDLSGNTHTISVKNGFNNIPNWDKDSFNVRVDISNNSNNTLSVIKNLDNSVVATLDLKDYKFLNTTAFITCCNKDIWRVDKTINSTTTEKFISVDYTYTYNGVKYSNIFSPDKGIYILPNGSSILNSSTIQKVGYIFDFNLLSDSISVSLVNRASLHLHQITNLSYNYSSGINNSYSKTLTLTQYRGYYGGLVPLQKYTLHRDQLVANFSVSKNNTVISQQFNVYKGTTVIVDDLSGNLPSLNVGSIGLKITFKESMLATSDVTSFDIVTIGDTVTFSITSPNFDGYLTQPAATTLLNHGDWNLYPFSGNNYDNTGHPLLISSSRLKLQNGSFMFPSATYNINLNANNTEVFYSSQYIGDPSNALFSSQPIYSGTYNNWVLARGGGYGFDTSNNNNTSYLQFSRVENSVAIDSTSYFVNIPPYYQFQILSNKTPILSLPYNPATYDNDNLFTCYLPLNSTTNTYNPFSTSNLYHIDAEIINNVQFTQLIPKNAGDFVTTPSSKIQSFVVTSNNINITYNYGLSNSNTYLSTLYNDVGNKLLYLSKTGTPNSLKYVSADLNNTGVTLSFLQTQPLFNGSTVSLSNIYSGPRGLDVSDNIFFSLSSFFLNSSYQLQLPILQGVNVSYYTTNTSIDDSGAVKITAYKYIPLSKYAAIDNLSLASTIIYSQYQTKEIPVPSYNISANVVKYRDIIASIDFNLIKNTPWSEPVQLDSEYDKQIFVSVADLEVDNKGVREALIFGCENNGLSKVTLVNNTPFLQLTNKVGMPIITILSDGSIITQNIAYSNSTINTNLNQSILPGCSNFVTTSIIGAQFTS